MKVCCVRLLNLQCPDVYHHRNMAPMDPQAVEPDLPLCDNLEIAFRAIYSSLWNLRHSNPQAFLPLNASPTQLRAARNVRPHLLIRRILASLVPSVKKALGRRMRKSLEVQVGILLIAFNHIIHR